MQLPRRFVAVGNDLYYVSGASALQTVHRVDGATHQSEQIAEVEGELTLYATDLGLLILSRKDNKSTLLNSQLETLFEVESDDGALLNVEVSDNKLFISYFDHVSAGRQRWIWRSDGSPSGTTLIHSAFEHVFLQSGLTAFDGLVYFASTADDGREQLWATDGTNERTYVYQSPSTTPHFSAPRLSFKTNFTCRLRRCSMATSFGG